MDNHELIEQYANHPDPYEQERRQELLLKWRKKYGLQPAIERAEKWQERDRATQADDEYQQRRHQDFQRSRWKELEAARSEQTLGQRLDQAMSQAITLAAPSAANAEGVRSAMSKPTATPPPRTGMLLDGRGDMADLLRRVAEAVLELERELDLARGRVPGPTPAERQAENDAELANHFRGFDPLTVSETAPHLGTAAGVREARRRLGLDAETGRPLHDSVVYSSEDAA